MKKFVNCLSVLILVLGLFLPLVNLKPEKAHALADLDQYCQNGTEPEQYTFLSHTPVQVFIPTKNRLEAVQVYVKAAIGTEANVHMDIQSENHGVIASRTERITNQWAWQLFEFPDIEMPMDIYGIALTDSGDLGKAVWMKGPSDCYDRGYAIEDNVAHMEFDFRFGVNAHDADTPSTPSGSNQTAPDPASSNSNVGTTKGSGSAPAASTSSSIAAPSNLTATNESNQTGTGIRLNWTASGTSNIDGYKIFRSNSATGGFSEIGKVIKGVGVYLDSSVTVGQTYYYLVRAYKGSGESASSNIANATAKDTFKEDLINSTKDNGGLFGGSIIPMLAMLAIPLIIGFFIFILIIVGIILLIRRSRNNQNSNQAPNIATKKDKK